MKFSWIPTSYDEVNKILCSASKFKFSSKIGGLFVYEPFDGSRHSTNNLPIGPGPISLFYSKKNKLFIFKDKNCLVFILLEVEEQIVYRNDDF